MKKGDLTIAEYVNKMRALGDELASAGKPVEDKVMKKSSPTFWLGSMNTTTQ